MNNIVKFGDEANGFKKKPNPVKHKEVTFNRKIDKPKIIINVNEETNNEFLNRFLSNFDNRNNVVLEIYTSNPRKYDDIFKMTDKSKFSLKDIDYGSLLILLGLPEEESNMYLEEQLTEACQNFDIECIDGMNEADYEYFISIIQERIKRYKTEKSRI